MSDEKINEFAYRSRVMVDIETLDTADTAIILSIGACHFDSQTTGKQQFYVELSVSDQVENHKRTSSIKTMEFWNIQNLSGMPTPNQGTIRLAEGLQQLADWIKSVGAKEFWCKGTDFDFSILEHAYVQIGDLPPWPYNAVNDYRTLKKQFSLIVPAPERPDHWNVHNALYDSIYQAMHATQILSWIVQNTPRARRIYV